VTEQKWVVSEESLSWVVISQYWFYVRYVFVFCLFFLKEKKLTGMINMLVLGFSFAHWANGWAKKKKKSKKSQQLSSLGGLC